MTDIRIKIKKNNGEDLELGKEWIDDLTVLSQSSSNPSDINYEMLASSGSIDLRDLDGELEHYIKTGEIDDSSLPIQIYINDNYLQKFVTSDNTYSKVNQKLQLALTDSLSNWDTLIYDGKTLSRNEIDAYNLLCEVLIDFGYSEFDIDDMISKNSKIILQNITIAKPYLKKDTYRNTINKFCQLAQLNVYTKKVRSNLSAEYIFIPVFVNARPISYPLENLISDGENKDLKNALKINKYQMISNPETELILKNKYDGIEIQEYSLEESPDDILYKSNELICCNNDTYIGNNIGVNEKQYDVYGGIKEDESDPTKWIGWLQFNFSLDMRKLNKILYNDISKIKITIFTNESYNEDEGTKITNTQESNLIWYEKELEYHEFNMPRIYKNKQYFNIYYCKIDDNGLLNIRCQIIWATQLTSTIKSEYLQNFTFNILKTTYSENQTIFSKGTKRIKLDSNELIQKDTMYGSKTICNRLYENINSDYSNGVATGKVKLFCTDYFNSDGNKIKDWEQGDIINVQDIIYNNDDKNNDGSQKYYKITSSQFNYSGSHNLDVNYQEMTKIYDSPNIQTIDLAILAGTSASIEIAEDLRDIYWSFIISTQQDTGMVQTHTYYTKMLDGDEVSYDEIGITVKSKSGMYKTLEITTGTWNAIIESFCYYII